MSKITPLVTKHVPLYKNILLILLVALFSAHYILVHHSKYGFFEVIKIKGYWSSLCFSFIIAVALIYAIYKVTTYLNKQVPYVQNKLKRITLQVIIGVFGVSLLAVIMVLLYFMLFNQPQRIYLYWHSDFPLIFTFIVIVNAFVALLYFTRENAQLLSQLLMFKKHQNATNKQVNSNSQTQLDNDYDDNNIAYITKKQRKYMVVYLNGAEFFWQKTINQTISLLPNENFFRISQCTIINKEIIESYSLISSRRLQLHCQAPFNDPKIIKTFIVSQNLAPLFLKWFENQNEQPYKYPKIH